MPDIPTFGISCHAGAEGVRVAVRGEIDLAVRDLLVAELRDAAKLGDSVVVDLDQVTFIDSMGVRALYEGYQAAAEMGHRLRVENAHDWVARVLTVTGVLELLGGGDEDGPAADEDPGADLT